MNTVSETLCADGYVWIVVQFTDETFHRYKRCRLNWMLANRQPIPRNYVIHHKDKNKLNDSPDNLELLTKAQHNAKHANDNSNKQSGLNNSVSKPDIDTDRLIELLNSGLSQRKVASLLGCSRGLVEARLHIIARQAVICDSNLNGQQILALYEQGDSMLRIATALNLSQTRVWRIINESRRTASQGNLRMITG